MEKRTLVCLFCAIGLTYTLSQTTEVQPANSSCTFADGKQMSIRYFTVHYSKTPEGQVWQPGNKPVLLFTQAPLSTAGADIPIGAFSIYLLPNKKNWTLVVNKNVTPGIAYDEKQDLVRVPMQMGELGDKADLLKLILVHVAPRQCNIRVYWGKTAGWAEFKEES
jgi:hypothetical protein